MFWREGIRNQSTEMTMTIFVFCRIVFPNILDNKDGSVSRDFTNYLLSILFAWCIGPYKSVNCFNVYRLIDVQF
jgi:hypothetical protein